AAALLRFPAFAATCTRSALVTTCGIPFSPRLACVASYPNQIRKTMELGTHADKAFMITRRGGFTMHVPRTLAAAAIIGAASATPAAAQNALTYSSWVPPT